MTAQTAQIELVHNFGGDGPLIHIAHANGFPSGTYRALAETLLPDHRVIGLPARPLWPDSQPASAPTWHPLAADLAAGLRQLGASNVLGIGHSLGGVLTLWASISHPHLFRAIVLVDPVILPPTQLRILWLMRITGLGRRHSLVKRALRRRHQWPSRQACFDHFRGKALFARWSDAALWDYVMYGTRVGASNWVELVYPPGWEAQIFATAPTGIWRDLPGVRVPCLFIRGEQSTTFLPEAMDRIGRLLPDALLATIPGAGHLLPMEMPKRVGCTIRRFFQSLSPG